MTPRQKRKFNKFKEKLNVLLIANNDWANLGAQYARSLRSIGVNATMFIRHKHKFNYPDQGILFKKPKSIITHIRKANIIHFMHSQNSLPNLNLEGKKIVVSHTGSVYRNKYKEINEIFNPIVDLSITSGSLFDKGAKNEHYLPGGVVDIERLKPVYERTNNKIIIGHFPSSSKMKSSELIVESIKRVKGCFEFRYSDKKVPWAKQIERMSECDIYIEKLTQNQGFATAVLEAASLGKIIVTSYAFEDKYKKAMGETVPFICVKNKEDMIEKLNRIIFLSDIELLEMKKKSRIWVENHHSYEATGLRLFRTYREIL